jgi:hypothetical protein
MNWLHKTDPIVVLVVGILIVVALLAFVYTQI